MPTIKKSKSCSNNKKTMNGGGWVIKDGKHVKVKNNSKENQDKFRKGSVQTKKSMVEKKMVDNKMNKSKMTRLQDFGSAFNFRNNNEKNQSNINRFFAQKGRVINSKYSHLNNKYHTIHKEAIKNGKNKWSTPSRKKLSKKEMNNLKKNQEKDRVQWEENFLKRSDEYLNSDNEHLTKYEKLKRANQRMKNNLNETRATLEKRKGYGWNRSNRNNAYDRMFNMSKKQLQRIRENPDDYLNKSQRDEFMVEPEGMETTSYIQKFPEMETEENNSKRTSSKKI